MGKGYSVKKGIEQSCGEIIVMMDGDFPFEFSTIDSVVKKLSMPGVEIVIGDRSLEQSVYPEQQGTLRKIGSAILSFFISTLVLPKISDSQCGIKGFKSAVAKTLFGQLTIYRYSFDLEILYLAAKRKLVIAQVPVIVRKHGTSNVVILRDGLLMIVAFLKIFCNTLLRKYDLNETRAH